jgi:hypothetical protein
MKVSQIVNMSIGLSATPPSQATFTVPMMLVDHADIPIDRRYRITSKSAYASEYTSGTDHYLWLQAVWGQNYNPSQAYLGRWISAASPAYMYFPNATTDPAVYAALAATAQLKIHEGAANEDINPDFTADTSMADVAASIQAALAAGTIPAAYTCTLDSLSRIVITSDNTGAAADAVSADTPAAGIDLTLAAYLGASVSVAGYDAEGIEDAMNAILALDDTPYIMNERGGSISEQVAFSTGVQSLDKICLLRITDADAKDSTKTTDAAYLIGALNHQQTHTEYTEHDTQNPDGALCGEVFPQKEATVNIAHTTLLGVSESGLDGDGSTVIPLNDTERAALEAKGCDYLIDPAGSVTFSNGLTTGGNEIRIMVAKMFMAAKVSEEVYGYMVANKVVTFSDADILAIKAIIEFWADEMVDRKALQAGYEITMPTAASFTAAQQATHIMDLLDLSDMETQRAVNRVNISLTWNV